MDIRIDHFENDLIKNIEIAVAAWEEVFVVFCF